VVAKGYLSFDPRRYADLGVSLVLPLLFLALGGIGFPGGAVYLRDDLMRSRLWRSAASLAGPFFTLLVLLLLAGAIGMAGDHEKLRAALAFLAFLQATALVLNMIPVPGFDGFGAIRPFLPAASGPWIKRVSGLVAVGFLILIFIVPGGATPIFRVGGTVAHAVGVPFDAVAEGFADFRFWLKS
jgi:Zn-dependent protease